MVVGRGVGVGVQVVNDRESEIDQTFPLPRYIRQTSLSIHKARNISKKKKEEGSYFCVRLCVCGVTRVANERRGHISRGPISAIKRNQIEAKNCITLAGHVQCRETRGANWGNTEIYLFSLGHTPLLPTSLYRSILLLFF